MNGAPGLILDRDGIVNIDTGYLHRIEDCRFVDGIFELAAAFRDRGFRLAIATNQSGIGRGLFDMNALNAMHLKMHRMAAAVGGRIDAVFFCPHTAQDQCECRKPKPGMLKMIAERFEVDPQHTPVVGDAMRDLQAGASLGHPTHLVLTGKGRKTLAAGGLPEGTRVHDDLRAFALDFLADAHE